MLVDSFVYQCELYFRVKSTEFASDAAKVGFAVLLLRKDASLWLRTTFNQT